MGKWIDENEKIDKEAFENWTSGPLKWDGVITLTTPLRGNPFIEGDVDRFEYRRSGRTYRMLQDAVLAAIRGARVWIVGMDDSHRRQHIKDLIRIVAPTPMEYSFDKGYFSFYVGSDRAIIKLVHARTGNRVEQIYHDWCRSDRKSKLFIDHAVYEFEEEMVRWIYHAFFNQKYDGLPTHLYIGKRKEPANKHSWSTYELPSFRWALSDRWWIQSRRSKGWVLS